MTSGLNTSGTFDCLYDHYFTLVGCSDSFYIYLGYDPQEFEQTCHGHIFDIIYEKDRSSVVDEIKRRLARESVFMIENRFVTRSGELRWVRVCAELRQDSTRGPWFHCQFFDISVLPVRNIQKNFHDQIIEHVFSIFLEHPENDMAIPLLLEQIGNIFLADRIYICEKSDDGTFLSTFQWSANSIPSLYASLKSTSTPPQRMGRCQQRYYHNC